MVIYDVLDLSGPVYHDAFQVLHQILSQLAVTGQGFGQGELCFVHPTLGLELECLFETCAFRPRV